MAELATFPNRHPGRDYTILHDCPEFTSRGIFYEHVTNVILDDLVAAVKPRRMTVEGDFNVRGGISTVVRADYEAKAPRAWRRRA
jgi:NADPH-dependent 7-cyano-7-deazaguanine reductase QueF